MIRIFKLKTWLEKRCQVTLDEYFVQNLYSGELLVRLVNTFDLDPPVELEPDASTDEKAASINLNNFLAAAEYLGIDKEHLFDPDMLESDLDVEVVGQVASTIEAFKSLAEQKGNLEKENVWRKGAAEVRAKQNVVTRSYAAKENKGLSDVTAAVSDFAKRTNADKDLRYQKQGQQKWNLFETNHQREKGITLEESLAEIEEFERTGKMPESMRKKREQKALVAAGTGFRGILSETITDHENKKNMKTVGSNSRNTNPGQTTQSSSKTKMLAMGKRELNEKPKPGGTGGAAFFAKFNNAQQGKYKPGNENATKKLW